MTARDIIASLDSPAVLAGSVTVHGSVWATVHGGTVTVHDSASATDYSGGKATITRCA